MGSSGEKKRKVEESSVGDRIEPQSVVPAIDTSNWPLLLKVGLHFPKFTQPSFV
jgi:hypothetical protein